MRNFLLWTFGRGTWQYDLMCGLILVFIFLTPIAAFHENRAFHPSPPWQTSASASGEVDQVLAKMEEAGKGFTSLSAELSQKKYTAILQEFDPEEKGSFAYARTKEGQALIRKEIKTPTPTIAIINKDEGVIYHPKIKQAQRIHLGQYKDKAEFMAI